VLEVTRTIPLGIECTETYWALEAVFRILELSHEALLAGTLITKRFVWPSRFHDRKSHACRNIYYQNTDLFKSQSLVDDLVDNIAFTLGIGREQLNIVSYQRPWGLTTKLLMNVRSLQRKDLYQDQSV